MQTAQVTVFDSFDFGLQISEGQELIMPSVLKNGNRFSDYQCYSLLLEPFSSSYLIRGRMKLVNKMILILTILFQFRVKFMVYQLLVTWDDLIVIFIEIDLVIRSSISHIILTSIIFFAFVMILLWLLVVIIVCTKHEQIGNSNHKQVQNYHHQPSNSLGGKSVQSSSSSMMFNRSKKLQINNTIIPNQQAQQVKNCGILSPRTGINNNKHSKQLVVHIGDNYFEEGDMTTLMTPKDSFYVGSTKQNIKTTN
eukprot:403366148